MAGCRGILDSLCGEDYYDDLCRDGELIMLGFLMTVAGVVMIVEGAPWFLSPPRMKKLFLGFLALPDPALRSMGLVLMLSGLLLVYLVRG
jgi:uncharacterized protein YjeT (DUF2065 family)